MKNKIFAIIILSMLSLPVGVQAVDNIDTLPVSENIEQTQTVPVENSTPETNETVQKPMQPSTPYKQPVSRRKMVKRFLKAMFGVALSSFVIFAMLTIYNKIRSNLVDKVKTPEGETTLETPSDYEEAVKTFLDKTKWNH